MAALYNSLLITTIVTHVNATTVIEISQSPGRPGLTVDGMPTVNVALHGDHNRAFVPLSHDIMGENEILDHQSK